MRTSAQPARQKETMSTEAAAIQVRQEPEGRQTTRLPQVRPDAGILAGIAIALLAIVAGIAITGVSFHYFFQPTGVLIVLGGTFGVMLITTPLPALRHTWQRTVSLFITEASPDRESLVNEIVPYARIARFEGLIALEPMIEQVSSGFLRDALLLAMDAGERGELQSALENKIRLGERQSEEAARVLEMAGGFSPTIGMMGTIVGLIDVLRQFSNLSATSYGIGAAFTSTIYGLALANLVLLPAAGRIRARASETLDLQELMMEGAMCLFDGMHPRMVRQRLESFLKSAPARSPVLPILEPPQEMPQP
jgi:chemotaxis protein MotA